MRRSVVWRAKDPFKVLGLARTASKAEVKSKYRELAKKLHPDNAEHGDNAQMEEVNRAYNLLLKEGAFERLHLKSDSSSSSSFANAKSARNTSTHGTAHPFGSDVTQESVLSKISALDPETERVNPDGGFLYQNRDTGEWMNLERPLTRAHQPRYASFGQKGENSFFSEMKQKAMEREEADLKKSRLDRIYARFSDHANTPFRNKYVFAGAMIVYAYVLYQALVKARAKFARDETKMEFYGQVRESRQELLQQASGQTAVVDTATAAAAILFLVAASKKCPEDGPEVPPTPDHFNITPPARFFEVIAGGG